VCSRAGWTATPRHPPPPGPQAACASLTPRQAPKPCEPSALRPTHPPPLSALDDPRVRTGHNIHDGGSARAWPGVGFKQEETLARDGDPRLGRGRTEGVESGGMDSDSSAPASARFAGFLHGVPLP
jgi:hypothetical protein